ncbi:hypothetical protein Bbelb_028220 [Branchiostoma belcheri]|nr:hypothetical protein Bbelb_028220 [Branchiostoma belcheri]
MTTVRHGHVIRYKNLGKTILQGTLEAKRRRDRRKKVWLDNIKDWTSLTEKGLHELAPWRSSAELLHGGCSFSPQLCRAPPWRLLVQPSAIPPQSSAPKQANSLVGVTGSVFYRAL